MSESFWLSVHKLFDLLDFTGCQQIRREELSIGLAISVAAVNGDEAASNSSGAADAESDSGSGSLVRRVPDVSRQVDWLFQAAGDCESIDFAAFKSCYESLLHSAYEEEVLELDLQRAIKALESSQEFQSLTKLFRSPLISSIRSREQFDAAFKCVTGRSASLGPKSQQRARNLLSSLVAGVDFGAGSGSGSGLCSAVKSVCKQLIAIGVSGKELMENLEAAAAMGKETKNQANSESEGKLNE